MYVETTALHKLLKLRKRIRAIQGGTAASKTISILQILTDKAQSDTEPTLTSTVSESFPHLKRGAIRDFKDILLSQRYWDDNCWNATDNIYTFPLIDPISHKLVSTHGSQLEFFSADQPYKVRGPRRKRLFVNEANNIPFETFEQLEVRTEDEIWLDWNPASEFWFEDEIMPKRDDWEHVILTYLDNEGLSQNYIQSIEQRKPRDGGQPSQWWRVYGMGLVGEIESRIYTGWNTDVIGVPARARLVSRGLDFGYSRDPAAIVDIYKYDQGFLLDEVLYRTGVGNRELANILLSLDNPELIVYADSQEPKSIDEIAEYGVNIVPAQKGPGSINQGIMFVQDQYISVTSRSTNLIKEYRNYLHQTNKDGKIINEPEDINNHLMDALRYGLETYIYSQARSKLAPVGGMDRPRDMAYGTPDGRIVAPGLDIGKLLQDKGQRDWRSI